VKESPVLPPRGRQATAISGQFYSPLIASQVCIFSADLMVILPPGFYCRVSGAIISFIPYVVFLTGIFTVRWFRARLSLLQTVRSDA
jgi:hypothetical protein